MAELQREEHDSFSQDGNLRIATSTAVPQLSRGRFRFVLSDIRRMLDWESEGHVHGWKSVSKNFENVEVWMKEVPGPFVLVKVTTRTTLRIHMYI